MKLFESKSTESEFFQTRKHIPMFGSHLTELILFDDAHSNESIPICVKHACRVLLSKKSMLETKGKPQKLKNSGIFRESPAKEDLDKLRDKYNSSSANCLFFNFLKISSTRC
jgi:hypothetical protein